MHLQRCGERRRAILDLAGRSAAPARVDRCRKVGYQGRVPSLHKGCLDRYATVEPQAEDGPEGRTVRNVESRRGFVATLELIASTVVGRDHVARTTAKGEWMLISIDELTDLN